MEENNDIKPVDTPTPGRVIDVQIPQDEPAEPIVPIVEAAGDPPETSDATESLAPVAVDETPVEKSADNQSVSEDKTRHEEAHPATVHKAGTPIVAIIAAVIVAVGLIGVTVFAYMKNQDGSKTDKYSLPGVSSQNQADTTGNEVDDTSKDVDNALKSADEADFPESELTDQSLGL
ncbi:hypothetical protein H0X10_01295 [Candidatus Saccharibacteria bacterium]|nr:hypothetical protein [Candidatus Saccharibacteria bacterium]